jgi:hypothetical protein
MLERHIFSDLQEYWADAIQRSALFMDILRERGNNRQEHNAATAPNVLHFDAELVLDGRSLERPVNYILTHIRPPADVKIDKAKPPFIVVDPRAGHGPGIGGMKHDSEIGVALAAGHACYFIGFLPEPVRGQTIEDVWRAEAVFVREVASRHPEAESKPVIIANCQAGWQIMMMAAVNPDLPGPVMIAGTPLSYWAGVHGKNPLRYLGGMLGGTWLTAMAGDLGAGIFDGANLVANFESMNPANTYWQKPYNVYSKADTEGARFLDFETWWGSPTLLNAGEMQWIADNLFVGNKLSSGALRTSDGLRIDLRNIKSPIIVFCSRGDDISPPQQALGWITDLYDHEREIVANGQTIVYCLHQSIGHLGIFVSGKVATKEHREFTSCMDMIDLAPPGLYEAVISEAEEAGEGAGAIGGTPYLFRLEPRTLDHIRELGGNTPEDDLCFATMARLSEVNLGLYRMFLAPWIQRTATSRSAEVMRRLHPNRLRFEVFSDRNPLMRPVAAMADDAREARTPVSPDNPFLAMEKAVSSAIVGGLEAYGAARDAMTEAMFFGVYGSAFLQAFMGLAPEAGHAGRRVERDLVREADEAQLRSHLEGRFEAGGPVEAALRAMIYVNQPRGGFDEQRFDVLRRVRAARPADQRRPLGELKEALKEQSLLIRLDEEHAVRAIPKLLPQGADERRIELEALHTVLEAQGPLPSESRRRLDRVDRLYDGGGADVPPNVELGMG